MTIYPIQQITTTILQHPPGDSLASEWGKSISPRTLVLTFPPDALSTSHLVESRTIDSFALIRTSPTTRQITSDIHAFEYTLLAGYTTGFVPLSAEWHRCSFPNLLGRGGSTCRSSRIGSRTDTACMARGGTGLSDRSTGTSGASRTSRLRGEGARWALSSAVVRIESVSGRRDETFRTRIGSWIRGGSLISTSIAIRRSFAIIESSALIVSPVLKFRSGRTHWTDGTAGALARTGKVPLGTFLTGRLTGLILKLPGGTLLAVRPGGVGECSRSTGGTATRPSLTDISTGAGHTSFSGGSVHPILALLAFSRSGTRSASCWTG
jgi:hypothetical protein